MAYSNPSVADFKVFFSRAFPFGVDPATSVTDEDISAAFIQTNATINAGLFPSQAGYTPAYLNLAAHFLVLTLRASSAGFTAQAGMGFLSQSKSVGSVSESYAIPQAILNNPLFAAYMTTPWGQFYLMAIYPYLSGQIFVVAGTTLP
jgi:hypothetical protein